MSDLQRAVLRFLGLWTVLAGVELLERVAYRAGVEDTSAAAAAVVEDLAAVVEDLADELEPLDLTDVVLAHVGCCVTVEAAPC